LFFFKWWIYTDLAVKGDGIPLLQIDLSPQKLQYMKETHYECLSSLCDEIGRGVQVDCIVNEDSKTARLEVGQNQPALIYFPEKCHVATETTFGYRYLDGDPTIGAKPIALVHLQTQKIPKNGSSVIEKEQPLSMLTVLPDCFITVDTSIITNMHSDEMEQIKKTLNVDISEWEEMHRQWNQNSKRRAEIDIAFQTMNLLGSLPDPTKPPGYRETFVLQQAMCPDQMSEAVQELVLPSAEATYNFVIEYRHELVAGIVSMLGYMVTVTSLLWIMVRVLLPAWILKRSLSWPYGVNLSKIWFQLVMLCFVSNFRAHTSAVLPAVMAVGASCYRDYKAAMEWAFLGILAWGGPDTIYPVLDAAMSGIRWRSIDVLGIAPFAINLLAVGEGWWKLVTLYVVVRSYQSFRQSLEAPATDDLERTQIEMQAHRQAHVKVD